MAGMIKKLMASGIAAKVISEARKPHNQQKIKDFVAQMQAKKKGQGRKPGTRYGAHRRPSRQPRTGPAPGRPVPGAGLVRRHGRSRPRHMHRIAVLDDYQPAASRFADWSQVPEPVEVVEFPRPRRRPERPGGPAPALRCRRRHA